MALELTDSHCHLDLEQFESDRSEVLRRAHQAGVDHILIPALDLPSSHRVVEMSGSLPGLHAAIGLHPTEAAAWTDSSAAELRSLLGPSSSKNSAIKAIGEIGLDYYWESAPHALQKSVLRQQLDVAAELGLPVILHMREARNARDQSCAADLLEIVKEWCSRLLSDGSPLAARPGVFHSFSGTLKMAQAVIALGFYIGVAGPVTYTKSKTRQAIFTALPLESLLLETDAPFQTPHPFRGTRNEPAFVKNIAGKIAELHGLSLESIAAITSANAARLFTWN